MKAKATDQDVMAFIAAVYPEAPELAVASFDEGTCLRDATQKIARLTTELCELRALEMNNEGACVRLKRERDEAISALERVLGDGLSAKWVGGLLKQRNGLFADNERLREALTDTIDLVEQLAEQQAMPDDWYRDRLAKARTVVGEK